MTPAQISGGIYCENKLFYHVLSNNDKDVNFTNPHYTVVIRPEEQKGQSNF